MADLSGPPAELRFTVEIVRAATGKRETFEMTGKVADGRHTHDRSAQRRD